MTARCAVCGGPLKARRSSRRYCGQACRKRAQRQRQAGQGEHVTVRVTACPPDSVTPLAAPPPRKGYGFAVRLGRDRTPVATCAWCSLPITEAELDPTTGAPVLVERRPHHPECAAYVAARAERAA